MRKNTATRLNLRSDNAVITNRDLFSKWIVCKFYFDDFNFAFPVLCFQIQNFGRTFFQSFLKFFAFGLVEKQNWIRGIGSAVFHCYWVREIGSGESNQYLFDSSVRSNLKSYPSESLSSL